MPHWLRTSALVALAIAIPVVVASATYAIGVRSLAPATRLQVNVTRQSGELSPSPGRSSDDRGGATPGSGQHSGGGSDDHGGSTAGTSASGGGSSPSGEDHGGSSGSDDGKSGSGSGGSSGSGSSGGSGSDGSSGHGGDD